MHKHTKMIMLTTIDYDSEVEHVCVTTIYLLRHFNVHVIKKNNIVLCS